MSVPAPHLTQYQFKPGQSGNPGGMSKRAEAWATCEKMGFNVIEEAIKRYRDLSVPHASRDFALGLVADRCLPKLKAVELNAANSQQLQQVLINVIAGKHTPAEDTTVVQTVEATVSQEKLEYAVPRAMQVASDE